MFTFFKFLPRLTMSVKNERVVRNFDVSELFSGPLNLMYSRITEFKYLVTILTNQMIVLLALVGLFVLCQ